MWIDLGQYRRPGHVQPCPKKLSLSLEQLIKANSSGDREYFIKKTFPSRKFHHSWFRMHVERTNGLWWFDDECRDKKRRWTQKYVYVFVCFAMLICDPNSVTMLSRHAYLFNIVCSGSCKHFFMFTALGPRQSERAEDLDCKSVHSRNVRFADLSFRSESVYFCLAG